MPGRVISTLHTCVPSIFIVTPMAVSLTPFYRKGHPGAKTLHDLPKVTRVTNIRDGL